MFDTQIDDLDADQTLTRAIELRALACKAEVALIGTAAHWADLHGVLDSVGAASVALPGTEGLVEFGGDGTPGVCEFAPAELGAELALSVYAATSLVADALDLRHRLPLVWAKMQDGDIRPWIGRRTAELSRHLSLAAVGVVDRRVARYGHSLTWGRLAKVVQAAVVEADPELAAAAADSRRTDHGVLLEPVGRRRHPRRDHRRRCTRPDVVRRFGRPDRRRHRSARRLRHQRHQAGEGRGPPR
ncbi:MAG: DUF222 domain-containing protein [Nocardioidaceae bacterium]